MTLSNGECERVVSDAKSFEDLEDAARVEQVMQLPEQQRDALMAHLIFQMRDDTLEMKGVVEDIKRERRVSMTLGHVLTGILAAALGLFGQPYTPTR